MPYTNEPDPALPSLNPDLLPYGGPALPENGFDYIWDPASDEIWDTASSEYPEGSDQIWDTASDQIWSGRDEFDPEDDTTEDDTTEEDTTEEDDYVVLGTPGTRVNPDGTEKRPDEQFDQLNAANVRNARGRRLADREQEDGENLGTSGHDTSRKTEDALKHWLERYDPNDPANNDDLDEEE